MSNGQSNSHFDVVVLGGGSAGYAAARTTAAAGLRTVVIEGGPEVGGLCILRGCMPTKALLYAAEVRHLAQQGAQWGLQPGEIQFAWDQVMARKSKLIREFADYRIEQLASGKFEFIRSPARFVDPHAVRLEDGRVVSADHFVISTGSLVAPSPLPQLDAVGYITSDDALVLKKPPKSMIVLGGGSIAVELAQFFARFDVEVTIIQRSEQLLRDFDADAAAVLENVFAREKIRVFTGTRLLDAMPDGTEKGILFEHQGSKRQARAQEILFALGRIPNTSSLALEAAGVKTDAGRITTNKWMQTNVPHIYAAGDCTSPYEIVHLAVQQGEISGHNIAHPKKRRAMDYRLLVSVVFTDPQLATVGLTEKRGRYEGIAHAAASYPFADHGKSLIMEARDGFVKLLADPGTGEILGGACVGPMGGELIHEIVVAMDQRMTARRLAALPHYHPTLAEIWTYPAEELADRISAEEARTESFP